jgi:hypothetical protein
VYFGYNYPQPCEFIHYIVDHSEGCYDYQHLVGKFNEIYDIYGSHAVMNRFFAELSGELQQALVDYAIKFYAPTAFHWTDEEKELLGIK